MSPPLPLAPEFQALATAVQVVLQGHDQDQRLAARLAAVTNWSDFIAGSQRHRIICFVQRAIKISNTGASFPPIVRQHLDEQHRQTIFRSLVHEAEINRLLSALTQHGIRALMLKGITLSYHLYGHGAMRDTGDIDLLISPTDLLSAHSVLNRLGYQCSMLGIGDTPHPRVVKYGKDIEYCHPNGFLLELHLSLRDSWHQRESAFERLWEHRIQVPTQQSSIPTMPDSDLPLYLIEHVVRHDWDRLCWLADIAILQKNAALWQAASDQAVDRKLSTQLSDFKALSEHFFQDVPLPSRRLRWFVRTFFSDRQWLERPERGSRAWFLRKLRGKAWRYTMYSQQEGAVAALKETLLNPVDAPLLNLPPAWEWLYPFLRPYGWVLRNFWLRRKG